MTAMILPKLGMCKNAEDAEQKLLAMGARKIGSGYFAKVYRIEIMEFVQFSKQLAGVKSWEQMIPVMPAKVSTNVRIVKVVKERTTYRGKSCDRAGLMTAKAAMATSAVDPLAPVYYGLTEFSDGSWIAEMEPLDKITDEHLNTITGGFSFSPLPDVIAASPFLRLIEAYTERNNITPVSWDMHNGNVMLRNGRPVVTDPIYSAADV